MQVHLAGAYQEQRLDTGRGSLAEACQAPPARLDTVDSQVRRVEAYHSAQQLD